MAKLNYVWNYLSSTLANFKSAVLGYRTYRALLVQIDENPPVATVVENTLGIDITYTYASDGLYVGTLNRNLFSNLTTTINGEKVEVFITPSASTVNDTVVLLNSYSSDTNTIVIITRQDGESPANNQLGIALTTSLEIRVYNK
jgi:hypothetical protein